MAKQDAPIVEVSQGRLQGRWHGKDGVASYKGIPFAAPPVGERRWRPPAPAEPWDGVRPAVKHGPMAFQRAAGLEDFIERLLRGQGWGRFRVAAAGTAFRFLPTPKQSEDCLYLTVRSPSVDPGAKLPVMVWIHGGDHQDGSGADAFYDANKLAATGVVTVSINYRLGVLGYLAHPELAAESGDDLAGNYGTLDQIAALRWVQENIAGFGGDPDNVTIFGESAGGESVLHMMTAPAAQGLFHRAIAQSPANGGQMLHLEQPFLHRDSGLDFGVRFAAALGITGPDQLAQLRATTPERLYELARADDELGSVYPVIDGQVLPESPFAAFAGGRQSAVPLVIGSNADEGTLIQPIFNAPMAEFRHLPIPENELQPEVRDAFGPDADRLLDLYPGLERRDAKAEIDFAGDQLFGAPAYHYARHHAAVGHPTWLYHFVRVPPSPKQTAGAFHAADVPFVHGTTVPVLPMTAADHELSAEMMRYWTDFAAAGDPNPQGGPAAGANHPVWPGFDGDDPQWLRLNHAITAEAVGRLDRYQVLNARTDRLIAAMAAM